MRRRAFLESLGLSGLLAAAPRLAGAALEGSDQGVVYLRPADAQFALHNVSFNRRIRKSPGVIAVCSTEAGVSRAISRARAEGLAVTVKSGGHSFEGFCLNDGGMVIDLSPMNAQRLLADGGYVAEPACRLMHTYEYLVPRGRLIPAGSCGGVGIAGLTLGGGYGMFSRQHGLTSDRLRGLRLVDGMGKIHDVGEPSELLRACRGAGNGHYGVVTQLRFETVAAPRALWRHVFRAVELEPARVADLAQTWFAVARDLPWEAFSAFVLNRRRLTILVTCTDEGETPTLARALKTIEAALDRRVARLQEALMPGLRRYYGRRLPLYFKNASAGYFRGYDDIRPAAPGLFDLVTRTPGLLFQVNTLGGAIGDPTLAARSAYAHRASGFLGEVQSYWAQPGEERAALRAVAAVQRMLKDAGVRDHYSNYPDSEFADWARAYYGQEGYERLLKVKQAYDPDNLFRYPQSIGAA